MDIFYTDSTPRNHPDSPLKSIFFGFEIFLKLLISSSSKMSETEQIVLYYVNGGVGEEEQEEVEYMVEEERGEGRQEEERRVFQCQFCPSTFDRELGLYGHLNSHKVGRCSVWCCDALLEL